MTFDIAKEAIDLFVKKSTQHEEKITFVGGEPLIMRKLIEEIIEYCTKQIDKKILFSILTNGLLLDKAFITFSKQNNIGISLSLDGHKKMHNLFRKIKTEGSWDVISQKFDLLISEIPESMILITLNPETIPYLTESIIYLKGRGAKSISISLNYMTTWTRDHLHLLRAQLIELAEVYKNWYQQSTEIYINIFDSRILAYIDGFMSKGRCDSNGNHISIAPNGDLFPCIAFVKNYSVYKLGNVYTGISYTSRDEFKSNREKRNNICISCGIKDRCFNWCACSNFLATGSINEISSVLCEFEKILIPITDKLAEDLYYEKNQRFLKRFYGIN
jgi:uncharacterized protein